MKAQQLKLNKVRKARVMRVRKKLKGTRAKPRMCVVKSNNHIQVQLIDDEAGVTLASTSTLHKEFRSTEFNRKNKESAAKLGERIAQIAQELNVKEAVFDRGLHKYHGILAALADSARAAGLQF